MSEHDRQDLDNRIAIARNQIAWLTEQAAAAKGAGAEERLADRLSEQEATLEALLKKREAMG